MTDSSCIGDSDVRDPSAFRVVVPLQSTTGASNVAVFDHLQPRLQVSRHT